MYSKDFKTLSLNNLRGKWGQVILAMLIFTIVILAVEAVTHIPSLPATLQTHHSSGALSIAFGIAGGALSCVLAVISIAVSGCMTYGISKYMLNFVRYGETNISYIFSGFSYGIETMARSFLLYLLILLFTFLWSLLLIIPGIIATLSYSQAFFILADNDDISALEALKRSKQMMKGYKGRLFCLSLSFIGWILLCVITFGIGFIFLAPYIQTAYANFYEYLRGIIDNR